jgi:hypothetical protein
MKKELSPEKVALVAGAMKGSRLAKFMKSVELINGSLAAGAWLKGASRSAGAGFYQGLANVYLERGVEDMVAPTSSPEWYSLKGVESCLRFGSPVRFMEAWDKESAFHKMSREERIALGLKIIREHGKGLKGISDEAVAAWISLVEEKAAARERLDTARPLPVITKIGLSPRVTKTLKEMGMDLDLPTLKMPEIIEVWNERKVLNEKTGEYELKMVREYEMIWEDGILHGMSRFSIPHCEACGKHIPSRMFVPLQAKDKVSGRWVSLYLGTDCAKNIFGVKDIGVKK